MSAWTATIRLTNTFRLTFPWQWYRLFFSITISSSWMKNWNRPTALMVRSSVSPIPTFMSLSFALPITHMSITSIFRPFAELERSSSGTVLRRRRKWHKSKISQRPNVYTRERKKRRNEHTSLISWPILRNFWRLTIRTLRTKSTICKFCTLF